MEFPSLHVHNMDTLIVNKDAELLLLLCYCCGVLFRANDMGLNGISLLMLGGTA